MLTVMPPVRFTDLPRDARLWVQATVLGSVMSTSVACGGGTPRETAPTCGPCCHGGGPECEQQQVMRDSTEDTRGDEEVQEVDAGPPDASTDGGPAVEVDVPPDDRIRSAPTCGPCCHGAEGPECGGVAPDGT